MRPHLASLVEDFRSHAAETAVVAHRGVRRYPTTYGELAHLAARFAAELERRSISPGDRIVLWGENSAEWIAVFFGCLLRSIIVVPLDAAGGATFAARVIADVDARLIVGDPTLLAQLDPSAPQLNLHEIAQQLPPDPLWSVSPAVTLDTPFQIVFTSGTTHQPRGIAHTHRNVLATLDPIEREMAKYRKYERLFHPLRFLQSLPLSHVFGQFMGLWCPALLAAQVHFAEDLEPAHLVDLIHRERISVLIAVPRILQLLQTHLLRRFASLIPQQFSIRRSARPLAAVAGKWWRWRRVHRALGWRFWAVISGGATLPADLEAFYNGLGFALIQGYGMTETSALVTLNHPFHIQPGTIGKPLPGREVRIADDGEVLVRGEVVASASWQHGAMQQRQDEWLATGDLAERGPDGELRFIGRKGDLIVTAAGMNIHPADLEQALAAQPGVRACVVVGCNFAAGPEAVAVVLSSSTADDLAAAVAAANRSLAEYQQIRYWLTWPELAFPHTSTGKLLRRVVAEWACAQLATQHAAPQLNQPNALPENDSLLSLLAEVSGSPLPTNADPNQLRLSEDLHLDSLGRVQLQSALEQRFNIELDDNSLASITTIAQLRTTLEQLLATTSPNADPDPASNAALAAEGRPVSEIGRDFSPGKKSAKSIGALAPGTLAPPPAPQPTYPRWPWWPWVRALRILWIEAVMRPLIWILARPKVICTTEESPPTPTLIICNHITAYDGALVLYALPTRLRHHVACTMSGEMMMDFRHARGQPNFALNALAPGAWFLLTALFNVFPLPRAHGFRRSFAHAGDAMDRGYSVLIFPEGSRSRDQRMHAFRPGIGLLAKQSAAPILPVALRGLYTPGRWFHAGRIEIHIGASIPPAEGSTDPSQLTTQLEAAVRDLIAT